MFPLYENRIHKSRCRKIKWGEKCLVYSLVIEAIQLNTPENTIASFLATLFYGADGLELDVWLSKDGELVVIHDPDTERVAGKKLVVKETTVEELRQLDLGLGQRIPTLSEVLEAVPPDIPIFVEIKDVDAAVPALQLVLEKKRIEKTMFISFRPEALEAIRRESNEARLGLIIGSMEAAKQAPILAQKLRLIAIAPPILGIKYLGLEAYRDYLRKIKKMGALHCCMDSR